jgi:hypothetical protein
MGASVDVAGRGATDMEWLLVKGQGEAPVGVLLGGRLVVSSAGR